MKNEFANRQNMQVPITFTQGGGIREPENRME
jgi:hypothetical protein